MFDADRNHQMTPRNTERTPVRPLLLETLERRLLLSGDAVLGGADPLLDLRPADVPQVVAMVEMPAAGAGIQGPSDIQAAPGPAQVIVPDPVTQAVLPESAFSITATYSTTEPVDNTLTGLGLWLHYNSSLLRWDSFSGVYAGGKVAQDSSPQNDTANADGDLSTDKYLMIAWMDLSGNWPGVGLPLNLYVANFTALPAFASGSTAINFSASSTPAGWTLDATSAIITPENRTPTDITLSAASVAENQLVGAVVGTFSTTDPDAGNTFAYSLVSGTGATDNGVFSIVGNQLQTAAVFNYEVRNSYSIRVRSTDQGGLSTEKVFSISVTDVNENPTDIALSAASVAENQLVGAVVGSFSTADPDAGNTFTYSLVSGTGATDNGVFSIVGNQLQTAAVFNYEARNSYSIRVRATDQGGLSTEKVFSISVTDVNENPMDITLSGASVAENQPVNTVVGSFSTTDPDTGNTFTYSLVSGTGATDNGVFSIVGNQLQTAAVFNYEVQNSYSIRVRSTDQGGLSTEKVFGIAVTDVNEAPTVALANTTTSLPENTSTAFRLKVADIVVTDDALGVNTLSLSGADAALFEIVGAALYLKAGATLDDETNPVLDVTVAVDDATVGGTPDGTAALAISVTNVNQNPTDIMLTGTSVAENGPVSTVVGAFSTADPDTGNTFSYSLVSGVGDTDNGVFAIVGSQLQTAAVFNYELRNSYSLRVRSTDQGGLYTEKVFSISITDGNEAPTVALANTVTSLAENTDTSSLIKVADIVVTDDALGTNVLSLSGAEAEWFEIVGTGLYLKAGTVLDHETNPLLGVTVAVDDADVGTTPDGTAVLAISITQVNQPPTVALTSTITTLAENTDTSSPIKVADIVVTDDGVGTNVLSLDGVEATLFEIVDTALYLKAGTALDYETTAILEVAVAVDDAAVGATPDATAALSITVTDVNEAPTVALANTVISLAENTDTSSRIKVADIVVTDDALGTNELSLSGTNAAWFEIEGLALYLKAGAALDYETTPVLEVTVVVEDATVGATPDGTAALSMTVMDVNEAPTVALANTVTSLAENRDTSNRIKVADIVVTDDALGLNELSLTGAEATWFEVEPTEVAGAGVAVLYLRTGTVLDYETTPVLEVTVVVDNSGVGAAPDAAAALSITVTDVNEAPTVALANTVTSLAENRDTSSRIKVADIVVTDDALGTNVLSLSGADAAWFELEPAEVTGAGSAVLYLRAGAVLDYATNPVLDVTVAVDDATLGSGVDDTAALAIAVTDVNHNPMDITLSGTSVTENQPVRTVVGAFSTTDPDTGNTFTYSLVSGTGDTDNGAFTISGNQLKTAAVFDYEVRNSYSIRVRSTDQGGLSTEKVFSISIIDVNEPPVVVNDTAKTDEDTPVIISAGRLLSNDSDPDGDTLSIVGIDTTGTRGLVTDNGNGIYKYDPNGQFDYLPAGASATDSFLVTVSDGHGATATGAVTITVAGASDLRIDQYSVRSSKIRANNYIKMSGYFDVPEAKIVAGGQIQVQILASGGPKLFEGVITINAADLRQGVYTYRASLPKGSSGAVTLLKLDTRRHTFELCVAGLDLSGLSYPLTLKLAVGDYTGSGQTN